MDPSAGFIVAALTLALPGPTNALLAVAGTAAGFRRCAHLALVAVFGYGLAVVVLVTVAAPLIEAVPFAGRVLRLVAALVLVQVAMSLWRMRDIEQSATRPVGWKQVFLTTLLNPKALVMAMIAMPAGYGTALAIRPEAAMLPVLIGVVSLGWIGIGAALRSQVRRTGWIERGGAIVLSSFAVVISVSALR